MNFTVFVPPPRSTHPARPFNVPPELRDVDAVRNLSLKTLSRQGFSRQGLPLDIHLTSTSIQDDHVVYDVTLESVVTQHQWVVSYRYSELLAFKNRVQELYTCHAIKCSGSCQAIRDYVAECFPKKRLVGSTSARAIKERKQKLENVLLHLLRCVLLPGSAMKCATARHELPRALWQFLGVNDEQDQRSLLQVYVDNRNGGRSKSFLSASTRTSSSSEEEEEEEDEDGEDCHDDGASPCDSNYNFTWDFVQDHDQCQCMICLEDVGSDDCGAHAAVTLPCHHSFHRECVFEWLLFEFHCPICRARVGPHAVTNYCRPKGSVQWWLGEFDEDPLSEAN